MSGRLALLTPLRLEARAARAGATDALVVRTGMGPERSAGSVRSASDAFAGAAAVAVLGVGGALVDGLQPGDVVVADRLDGTDGSMPVAGAELIAAELRRHGVRARVGPIACSDHVVTGPERAELAESGALAVDMESLWLAPAAAGRPFAVVRAVADTPGHELRSPATVRHIARAYRALQHSVPALEQWAAAAAPRSVLLAAPRSFCAGVVRAIDVVERALAAYGAPIYVRRQIVHNTHVVSELEAKGAVFVHEIDDVPGGARVILAAHGVTPEVKAEAARRGLDVIDATCPLVAKVHSEARRFASRGHSILLVGHDDHEEVEGTRGEAPAAVTVVGSLADAEAVEVADPTRVAYLTQTTLAVDEVEEIVDRLRERFPDIQGPRSDDICYATQNRQDAVRAISDDCDLLLVVGSANSSNSRRLTEVAERIGCRAHLVDGPSDIHLAWLEGASTIGVTAGASAPETLVQAVVDALAALGPVTVEERHAVDENVSFSLPAELRDLPPASDQPTLEVP